MIELHVHKPITRKDFKAMAAGIRASMNSYGVVPGENDNKISFNAGGFIVRCLNSEKAIEALAVRIEKGSRYKPPPKIMPQVSYSKSNIIKRNADDPAMLSELIHLTETK